MKELLDLNRREFVAAKWFMDEETAQTVNVSEEVQQMNFDRFMELRSFITQTQKDLCVRYVAIGCALLEIKRSKLYYYVAPTGNGEVGYGNFKKFCKDVFGIAETTAKRMVDIAENFATIEGTLDVKYLPYSYSQLAELLTIDEKYRAKITSKCSVRDIRRLGELYKKEPPTQETTVEKDLERWREIHEEEQAKKNAKKNSLTFVPARKSDAINGQGPTSDLGKNMSVEEEFDGEDERDLSTPTVEKDISFEAIRKGLLRQLELLRTCDVGVAWTKCADIFEEALNTNTPRRVANSKDVVQANIEVARLKEKLNAPRHESNAEEIYIHKDMPEVLIRDAIRRGFELLRVKVPSLNHAFCDIVAEELDSGHMQVYSTEAYDLLFRSNYELQRELEDLKTQSGPIVREGMAMPPAQKLTLKNAKERKEWLEGYESWPVWLDVPEVSKTFYRYDFINGAALIIEVGTQYYDAYTSGSKKGKKPCSFVRYSILDESTPKFDCGCAGGTSAIVDWLTKHSKEI